MSHLCSSIVRRVGFKLLSFIILYFFFSMILKIALIIIFPTVLKSRGKVFIKTEIIENCGIGTVLHGSLLEQLKRDGHIFRNISTLLLNEQYERRENDLAFEMQRDGNYTSTRWRDWVDKRDKEGVVTLTEVFNISQLRIIDINYVFLLFRSWLHTTRTIRLATLARGMYQLLGTSELCRRVCIYKRIMKPS